MSDTFSTEERAHAVASLPGLLETLAAAQQELAKETAPVETSQYAFFEPHRPMFDNEAGK